MDDNLISRTLQNKPPPAPLARHTLERVISVGPPVVLDVFLHARNHVRAVEEALKYRILTLDLEIDALNFLQRTSIME